MILDLIDELADTDLYALCDAIDTELQCREGDAASEGYDSARRRAVKRGRSYRHHVGAGAPPVRCLGIGRTTFRRRAA
jgi:hypothetical protein